MTSPDTPTLADAALVTRAKEGDFDAFEELVNRHERTAYRVALNITRHTQDAEDAVQTAFLAALEKLDGFREEAAFKTWILRIVTNAALKQIRRRSGPERVSLDKATEEDENGHIPHPEWIAEWSDNPSRTAESREVRDALDEAVDALPLGQRVVFVLRDIEGLSTDETARLLDLTISNVKVRLLRARLALRESLTRVFGDETRRLEAPPGSALASLGGTSVKELLRLYEEDAK